MSNFNFEKEHVTNAEEATEVIADYLSSSSGIYNAIIDRLDDVEEFAHKWGVPFDRTLISKMVSAMDTKRWDDDGHRWTSSSEMC